MTPAELVTRVRDGHRLLTALVADLTDDDVRAPSALPGWSRGHVITHLADLADAFARQADHARRGLLVDVYDGGRPGRDAAIERGAGRAAHELREATGAACAALEAAWEETGEEGWSLPVRYRDATLLDTAYARWREVGIHLTDLDLGYRPSDWSVEFCDHVAGFLISRAPTGTHLTLVADDADLRWTSGTGATVAVRGRTDDLAAWLAGRAPDHPVRSDSGDLPELGPWP
ncbi:maleylpyruvate isomerase family mycothiol-dependent enzyme [Streptosporangium sp. CA-135522]|uniref:maleylpyruvate isomerase family mycothiol-dependent enzyme n=1 Tax=Streptosporangium sp. CA-135522 TaxID=3240072 RepID=UPI003D8BD21B